ncbi:MAG: LptA/OstA family protein [Pseudomonadota bacterium]
MVKMDSRLARYVLGAAASAFLLVGSASAQLSSEGGPIRVNADTSSVLERERRVVVIGNVDIVQGDARLRADQVTLFYSDRDGETGGGGIGGSFGDIERMTAVGDVFYVTPDLKARGDTGTYNATTDVITLTGEEVVLIRGEDVATGCELELKVAEGRSNLKGCEGDGVRILIMPEGTSEP